MSILRQNKLFLVAFFGVFINIGIFGQVLLESSYIAQSNYHDGTNTATGGRGDFKNISLFMQIPIFMKTNELEQITAWAIAINGVYASMDNTDLSDDQCLSQILNSTLGVAHMRPINENWTFTASLGAGVFTDLSHFSADNIMTQAGALFIRRMLPNLYVGFGVALNNVLGFPMLFPSLCLDWRTGKRFEFKIQAYDTVLLSAGMKINDLFTVRLLAQVKGMSAIVERNNESKIFTKQLLITGLQPEIYVNKIFSIPITVGVSVIRAGYFQDRSLIAFFNKEKDTPYFTTSLYASIGLKFFFNE